MARLTAPNGAVVDVPKEKVDGLLARGFTAEETAKKSTAKKASSRKSEK